LCHLLALRFFFLLDDFLEFFFGFWSSSCASCFLGFEIQTLCFCVVNVLIKGEIEEPSGQYLGSICDESLTCHSLNLNPRNLGGSTIIYLFMWRIACACLVMCR
jgi:hypothetical protein